tara:strand:+ start:5225 stop:5869 length:645 start_codon:yes stop_codon:yes gene_type:complete
MEIVKTKFKNTKFLYEDKENSIYKISNSKNRVDQTHQGFQYFKSMFVKLPPDNELLEAFKKGWSGIDSLIRESASYPEGDVETILKMNGRYENYKRAKEFINASIFSFVNYNESEYIFKNGAFTFNKDAIKEFEELHTYYSTNEKQNKAVAVMQKICDGLNSAFDHEIIHFDSKPQTLHANTKHHIVKKMGIDYITVNGGKVVPDMKRIERIRE